MSEDKISKIIEQSIFWITNNKNTIFNFIGKLSILTLIAYLIWRILEQVTKLQGFSFDPILSIIISIIGLMIYRFNLKHSAANRQQQKLLKEILAQTLTSKKVSQNLNLKIKDKLIKIKKI